ncbi:hypothetical protein chiPu_0028276, partial [Chiloscyllium punctatum]|nr:hypothetical protein [Chiloscyllium punctatum]
MAGSDINAASPLAVARRAVGRHFVRQLCFISNCVSAGRAAGV